MSFKSPLLAAAALCLVAPIASAQSASDVVASVNGTDITLGEMIVARTQLPQQYAQLPNDVLFDGILQQLIQQQLLADALEEVPARLEIALKNETRALRANEEITNIATDAVTDEALQAAYDARFADAEPTTEWNASHILVETEERAAELVEEASADGADFAELAKEFSTGPSGPSGGELGWFGPGMMVPSFEEAVESMEAGAIAGPIETQFGWHVIKLNETRLQEAPSLDALRDELSQELQQQAVEAAIAELEGNADVTRPEEGAFDPALLGDVGLIEN